MVTKSENQADEHPVVLMAGPLQIRVATEADIPMIRDIAEAAWPVAFGDIVSPEFLRHELDREYSDAALKSQMQEQAHCFLMAEQPLEMDGPLAVGFISYSFQADAEASAGKVATVHKLYLLPNLKGKGYGATLLNVAIEQAIAAECTRVELSVNRQNVAVKFYERQGFSIVCARDIEVGPGFTRNDYLMAKPLA